MNKQTKIIFAVVFVLLFVLIMFVACGSKKSDSKNENQSQESPTSLFDLSDRAESTNSPSTTTTRPEQTPAGAKTALSDLPVSSTIDMYYPEMYLSARYEAIVAGNLDGQDDHAQNYLYDKIAIAELNDPANSDLDPARFTALRNLAISVAKAEATGEGASLHSEYFTGFTTTDTCTDFTVNAAGAISMPYPGDDSWALAIVNWTATCFPFGADQPSKINTVQQTVYIHRVNNVYRAVPLTSIPRKSLDEFITP